MSRWHLLYLSLLLTVSGCSTLSPPPSANASTEPRLHPDSATAASTDEAETIEAVDTTAHPDGAPGLLAAATAPAGAQIFFDDVALGATK